MVKIKEKVACDLRNKQRGEKYREVGVLCKAGCRKD
jgi:hypothetical protein